MKNKLKLDEYEQDLVDAFESNPPKSRLTRARKKQIQAIAESTITKNKRINIRISGRDLDAIQRRAMEEGVPYQTLVSSVLHKYVSGSLQDISANKPANRVH